jgi:hypothetical protein
MNTLSRSVVSRFTIRNFLKKNSFKYTSPAFSCQNFTPTIDADIKKMSTAVEHKVYESILFSSSISPQVLEDFSVVGKEMQLKQAFKVHNEFDKFILLLSHGDTDSLDENKPVLGSISDMSLSGKVSYFCIPYTSILFQKAKLLIILFITLNKGIRSSIEYFW